MKWADRWDKASHFWSIAFGPGIAKHYDAYRRLYWLCWLHWMTRGQHILFIVRSPFPLAYKTLYPECRLLVNWEKKTDVRICFCPSQFDARTIFNEWVHKDDNCFAVYYAICWTTHSHTTPSDWCIRSSRRIKWESLDNKFNLITISHHLMVLIFMWNVWTISQFYYCTYQLCLNIRDSSVRLFKMCK